MSTVKPWDREVLSRFDDRFLCCSGDPGDGFVLHSNLLFTSSPHQFLIEFLKSRIMLTINSTRMRVLIRRSISGARAVSGMATSSLSWTFCSRIFRDSK
jgi:hypothetical protein